MASCTSCKRRTASFCYVHKYAICDDCCVIPSAGGVASVGASVSTPAAGANAGGAPQQSHRCAANCVIRNYFDWLADGEYEWPPRCGACQQTVEADPSRMIRLVCKCIFHRDCLANAIYGKLHVDPSNHVGPIPVDGKTLHCLTCKSTLIDPMTQPKSKLRDSVMQFLQDLRQPEWKGASTASSSEFANTTTTTAIAPSDTSTTRLQAATHPSVAATASSTARSPPTSTSAASPSVSSASAAVDRLRSQFSSPPSTSSLSHDHRSMPSSVPSSSSTGGSVRISIFDGTNATATTSSSNSTTTTNGSITQHDEDRDDPSRKARRSPAPLPPISTTITTTTITAPPTHSHGTSRTRGSVAISSSASTTAPATKKPLKCTRANLLSSLIVACLLISILTFLFLSTQWTASAGVAPARPPPVAFSTDDIVGKTDVASDSEIAEAAQVASNVEQLDPEVPPAADKDGFIVARILPMSRHVAEEVRDGLEPPAIVEEVDAVAAAALAAGKLAAEKVIAKREEMNREVANVDAAEAAIEAIVAQQEQKERMRGGGGHA